MSRKTIVSSTKIMGMTSATRVNAYCLSDVPFAAAMSDNRSPCLTEWMRQGAPCPAPPGCASYDFEIFQYRMMNDASSVLGIPRTLLRATAIMSACQYGMIGASSAASLWIWR